MEAGRQILEIVLCNSLLAGLLALLALTASWSARQPALAHALWLLVLIKLVTPPLVRIPLLPHTTAGEASLASPAAAELEPGPPLDSSHWQDQSPLPPVPAQGAEASEGSDAAPARTVVAPELTAGRDSSHSTLRTRMTVAIVVAIGLVWAAGSLLWLIIAVRRIRAFRQWLTFAEPASTEITAAAAEIAARLGLRRMPRIECVPGEISPMLWGLPGRLRLLLPLALIDRLSEKQMRTVLAHELAHAKRGDPWVRLLEAFASALLWWHPLMWWARHSLRAAEEACCDAWVAWALPDAARDYADSLIETVDFLSQAPVPLTLTASGIGQVTQLKRRVHMILSGDAKRTLSGVGLSAVLAAAVMLLPWLPTWADSVPPGKTPGERAEPKPEDRKPEDRKPEERKPEESKYGTPDNRKPEDREPNKLDQAKAEVEKAQYDLKMAEERLRKAEARLRELTLRPGGEKPGTVPQPPVKGGDTERRLADLEKKLDLLLREMERMREKRPDRPGTVPKERDPLEKPIR